MIGVNRVYETVQNILNVEQRGQLPPGDFNKIANLAQLDLFNKLFYDEPYFSVHPKGGVNSDLVRNILEMQDVFVAEIDIPVDGSSGRFALPSNLYRLDAVYFDPVQQAAIDANEAAPGASYAHNRADFIKVEKMNHQDYSYVERSPLTQPTRLFPKYLRFYTEGGSTVEILPRDIDVAHVDYVRQPTEPVWDSWQVGAGGVSIFNNTSSQDFELHPAMEQDLIHRILFYAGVSIREEGVSQIIQGISQRDTQEEKQ